MEENKNLFETGKIVMTRGIHEKMIDDGRFCTFVLSSYRHYIVGDWGDTCEEDAKMNDEAVKSNEDRIFAVYKMPNTDITIWIITEWDHSVTTILFPSEY